MCIVWTATLAAIFCFVASRCSAVPPCRGSDLFDDDDDDDERRVVGGTDADRGEFPHLVSVRIHSSHTCGGSLVTPEAVLTAAHCCLNPADEYSVRSKCEQILAVREKTSFELLNDICVLILNEEVPITPGLIEVAALDDGSREPDDGELMWITGWGTTSEGGSVSNMLLKAQVPYLSNQQCEEYYQDFNPVVSSMMCAGFEQGGVDSCQGDSGGPLMFSDKSQVGLTSWGKGCAKPGYPGVYTRLSAFSDWIAANTVGSGAN